MCKSCFQKALDPGILKHLGTDFYPDQSLTTQDASQSFSNLEEALFSGTAIDSGVAPAEASRTTYTPSSGDELIDSLIRTQKWGGSVGQGVELTYSFPWTTSDTATFLGPDSTYDYSLTNEHLADERFGFDVDQREAFREALGAWADVADITFSEVDDTSSSVGEIRIAFTSAREDESDVSAWAKYPSGFYPRGGDIWFQARNVSESSEIGTWMYRTLMHEIGHSLGLGHPFEGESPLPEELQFRRYSIMNYDSYEDVYPVANFVGRYWDSWDSYRIYAETPMVLDILAIQHLYGPNTEYNADDTTYTFSNSDPFFKTIWDAGGTDTLDLSNFSTNLTIDLTPGKYSSVAFDPPSDRQRAGAEVTYTGKDNLGIAYGATIEKVVGGSGNDLLKGNKADNFLTGGLGDDVLYGGAGDDRFDWSWGDDLVNTNYYGRGGADIFYGGLGDDDYTLQGQDDTVIEYESQGEDWVFVDFDYELPSNVEGLLASRWATQGLSLTGNGLNNSFRGSAHNDLIDGLDGDDKVYAVDHQSDDVSPYYRSDDVSIVYEKNGDVTIDYVGGHRDTLRSIESIHFSDKTQYLFNQEAEWLASTMTAAPHYVGETLTATFEVSDLDGISDEIEITWHRRLGHDGDWLAIGHTGDDYTLISEDVGYEIGWQGSVTDNKGFTEVSSIWTLNNSTLVDLRNTPAEWFSQALAFIPQRYVGDVVNVAFEVTDLDGISNEISVSWHRWKDGQWTDIDHSGATYTITNEDVGSRIGFSGSFTDDNGFLEESEIYYPNDDGSPVSGTGVNPLIKFGPLEATFYNIDGVSETFSGSTSELETYYALNVDRDSVNVIISNSQLRVTQGTETDILVGFERLRFKDDALAFDAEGRDSAGAGYRLYKAAFDRTPDDTGMGYWISVLDAGTSLNDIANAFIISDEFTSLYGADPDTESFVTALYNNVLDRDPDTGGLNYWQGLIDGGTLSRAEVLANFSESDENIANTDPLIELGVVYQPYGDAMVG